MGNRTLVSNLGKAMRSKPKHWTRVVDNKMRGAYGETNFDTKTIRINKKKMKKAPMYSRPVNPGATAYPEVLGTIVHEEAHRKDPKATEKEIRKRERKLVTTMTPKQKKKAYSRFT